MKKRRPGLVACCLLTALALSHAALAGDSSPADRAAARALFDQARSLVAEGKLAEACPKLEESQRLDPGMGTAFNLADCYEKMGRTTSAWTIFLEVASQARGAALAEKEKVARERAAALEPKLSRLAVMVPQSSQIPGLQVRRDGSSLGKAMWNTALPVDPGSHKIEVSAPGKRKWTGTVEVPAQSASSTIAVPALVDDTGDADKASSPSSRPSDADSASGSPLGSPKDGSTQRLIGLIAGGVGVVGLGASVVIGLGAKKKVDDASPYCSATVCNDLRGVELRDDARSQANVATVVGVIGTVALAGGAVLYFTAPSGGKGREARRPAQGIAIGPGSMLWRGEW
ncbi:MAG: hypothetical protein HY898_17055 [Deltaproteobacteria bacterium]|nr:hypothetical protein [Deltaproteobacteria bacterium]